MRVRDMTKELLNIGCYEVSLGDTKGTGNPTSVGEMFSVALGTNPVENLAGHPSFVGSSSQLKTPRILCGTSLP